METTYLAHHGIKGMKWGIRRYQDKNGSYTQAGKKRYRDNLSVWDVKERDYNRTYQTNKSYKEAKRSAKNRYLNTGNKEQYKRDKKQARKEYREQKRKDTKELYKDVANTSNASIVKTGALGAGAGLAIKGASLAFGGNDTMAGQIINAYGNGTIIGSAYATAANFGSKYIARAMLGNIKYSDVSNKNNKTIKKE